MDYIAIEKSRQTELEEKHPAELAAAGLYLTYGYRQGLAEADEVIRSLHNILVAILVQPE